LGNIDIPRGVVAAEGERFSIQVERAGATEIQGSRAVDVEAGAVGEGGLKYF
jgi:hypothetical protein